MPISANPQFPNAPDVITEAYAPFPLSGKAAGFAGTNLPMNSAKPSNRKTMPAICKRSLICSSALRNREDPTKDIPAKADTGLVAEVAEMAEVLRVQSAHSEVTMEFRPADQGAWWGIVSR
jgi:hypothetical protein